MAEWLDWAEKEARMKARRDEMWKKREKSLLMVMSCKGDTCSICGGKFTDGVVCAKARSSVCTAHCAECEYHAPVKAVAALTGKWCVYQEPERPWKSYVEEKTRDGLLAALIQKLARPCAFAEKTDDDGLTMVVDRCTGKISRCRVRFLDGRWHYGEFVQ